MSTFTPRPGAAPLPRMVLAQARMESRLMLRNGEQLLLAVVIPVIVLVGMVRGAGRLGLDYDHPVVDVVTPGVLALAVMSTSFTSLAIATGFERRYGILKRLGASPLPRSALLVGKVGALLLVEAGQLVVLSLVGQLLGWDPRISGGSVLGAVLAVLLGTAAFASLGLLMAGALRAEATLAAANLVYLLLLAAGAVVLPASAYGGFGNVAQWLPSGALGEAVRGAFLDGSIEWRDLAVLLGWTVLGTAATARDVLVGVATARWVRPLAWATLLANIAIVVTGGAVRLTSSGLGCPTWPRCTDGAFRPHGALSFHRAIEFGNRTLTFVLVVIAVATLVVMWRTARRDLRRMALVIALSIPAQAVIGGITVLTDLNPWIVSLHLLLSMAIVGVAVRLLLSVDAPLPPARRGPVVGLAWATFASAWAVLYVGTAVTGSGPHAGDLDAKRNGLDPLQMSQLHADLVFLFVGLTLGLLFLILAVGGGPVARRAVIVLLAVELAQGTIGFVQYFTDLPELLVGFHMLGAAVISATVTWVLLRVRHPAAPAPTPLVSSPRLRAAEEDQPVRSR